MARRASSRVPLVTLLLSAAFILAVIGGGAYFFIGQNNPYRTVQPLDTSAYLENANSLRGNVYRVEGTVQNSLSWSPTRGRLISIKVGEAEKGDRLAILVPVAFNHINLQKGQRYQFKVEVVKDGIIEARDLHKS
jgi:hypothetical protein